MGWKTMSCVSCIRDDDKDSFINMLLAFSIVVCLASLARRRHLRSDIVKFRTEVGIGSNHFTTLTQISNCLFSTLYSFHTNVKFSLERSVCQQFTFTPRTSSMHFSYYTMMHMQYLSLKGLLERKWQITSMLQMCNILYWRCDFVDKQFFKNIQYCGHCKYCRNCVHAH